MFQMLNEIIYFLIFFDRTELRDNLFGAFYDLCNNIHISDYYQIETVFKVCQQALEMFLSDLDSTEYYTEINNYTIQHVIEHRKLPLFMELLLQDKSTTQIIRAQNNIPFQMIVNDIETIIEL